VQCGCARSMRRICSLECARSDIAPEVTLRPKLPLRPSTVASLGRGRAPVRIVHDGGGRIAKGGAPSFLASGWTLPSPFWVHCGYGRPPSPSPSPFALPFGAPSPCFKSTISCSTAGAAVSSIRRPFLASDWGQGRVGRAQWRRQIHAVQADFGATHPPDGGEIGLPKAARVASVDQEHPATPIGLLDTVLAARRGAGGTQRPSSRPLRPSGWATSMPA